MASESAPSVIDSDELHLGRVVFLGQGNGVFYVRIEHTARTWGADILALLDNHIQSLCKKRSQCKQLIRKYSGTIGLSIGLILFISLCFSFYFAFNRSAVNGLAELKKTTQNSDSLTQMHSTIDYVAQFVASGAGAKERFSQIIIIVVGIVICIAIGVWAGVAASTTPASFLLLTNESIKHKADTIRREKRTWFSFLFSILTAIATGIVSNILFQHFFN